MDIDDQRFLIDMRQKVLKNKEQGLDVRAGLSDEDIQKAVRLMAAGRASASVNAETKAKSTRKTAAPMSDDELKNLFN